MEQLLPALCRESIKPGLAIVLGKAVFCRDQAMLHQSLERWIERSMSYLQHLVRPAFNGLGYGMPMCTPEGKSLQDEQIECALQQVQLIAGFSSRHSTRSYAFFGRMSRGKNLLAGTDRIPIVSAAPHRCLKQRANAFAAQRIRLSRRREGDPGARAGCEGIHSLESDEDMMAPWRAS